MKANPYGGDPEYACSWIPLPASELEVIVHGDDERSTKRSCTGAVLIGGASSYIEEPSIDEITQAALNDAGLSAVGDVLPRNRRLIVGSGAAAGQPPAAPSVCVIVCFRDLHAEQKRREHLTQFVPHMMHFLGRGVDEGRCARFQVRTVTT